MRNNGSALTEMDSTESIDIVSGSSIFMRAQKKELEMKLRKVEKESEKQEIFSAIVILEHIIKVFVSRNKSCKTAKIESPGLFPSRIFRKEIYLKLRDHWKGEFNQILFDNAWRDIKNYCDIIATRLN